MATFLGMVAWLSMYIPHFSVLCESLYAITGKIVKSVWSGVAQRSFDSLKEALVFPPVLAHPNYSLQFKVYCDVIDLCIDV